MWSSDDFSSFGQARDTSGGFLPGNTALAAKKLTSQTSLMPCTCAEVALATQDGDKFVSSAGVEFSQITVVGVIRSVNESTTRVDYEIDDYTGPYLQVKLFIDEDETTVDNTKSRPLRELSYVRVFGHVRSFQSSRSVVAFRVVPLNDMNELTAHILEVVYCRMLAAKAKAEDSSKLTSTSNNAFGMSSSSIATGGLTVLQNQILSIVRAYPSDRGISVVQMCERLRGVPERQLREDLDFLSNEGHVYSTVDDDHFRATEA